jgi:hypothetical protein
MAQGVRAICRHGTDLHSPAPWLRSESPRALCGQRVDWHCQTVTATRPAQSQFCTVQMVAAAARFRYSAKTDAKLDQELRTWLSWLQSAAQLDAYMSAVPAFVSTLFAAVNDDRAGVHSPAGASARKPMRSWCRRRMLRLDPTATGMIHQLTANFSPLSVEARTHPGFPTAVQFRGRRRGHERPCHGAGCGLGVAATKF